MTGSLSSIEKSPQVDLFGFDQRSILWTVALTSLLLAIVGLVDFASLFLELPFFLAVMRGENRAVELLTAASFMAAGCIPIGIVLRNRTNTPIIYLVGYTLFGLFNIFFALEELSYGQHLFGWDTFGVFELSNLRGEINLHNMRFFQDQTCLGYCEKYPIALVGILIPAAVGFVRGNYLLGGWYSRLLPNIYLVGPLALAQVPTYLNRFMSIVGLQFSSEEVSLLYFAERPEYRELGFAVAFLTFSLDMARRYTALRASSDAGVFVPVPWPRNVLGIALLIVCLGIAAGSYGVLAGLVSAPILWWLKRKNVASPHELPATQNS